MSAGLEFRVPEADELRPTLAAAEAAFGDELREDEFERHQTVLALDRVIGAYDGGRPVGLTLSHLFELTTPGGLLPAAGVTFVGVAPSHRRRGVLRELMRRQLEDVHRRGEPAAILWASEAAIYGRFGYGISAPAASLEAQREGFSFRDDPGAAGTVRLVGQDEAAALFPAIHERVRRERPGMIGRTREWWEAYRLPDPEHWRRGAGPKFYALLELDGAPAGYAMYRVKGEWERGFPKGEARVLEAAATTPEATRELWRFLFGVDLVTKVTAFPFDPASPLFLMVTDPRRLGIGLADGLWLRLVDVAEMLQRRSWAADDSLVLEVRDEFCAWNDGRYRVGESVGRSDDEPDLRLPVADLASAYLGAFDFSRLADAGRVAELRPGALERASALFRTPVPPFCPEIF